MSKLSRRKFIQSGILGAIGLFLLDVFWFEKYVIDWNYFDISKTQDDKVKVIQISDLHFGKLRSSHKSIAEKINKLQPDLIFLTGDSVNKTDTISELHKFLQLIDNSIPKYAIMGNWEYWGKVDVLKFKTMLSKNNCELLINENRTITLNNRQLSIIGVDDLIGGEADYQKAIAHIKMSPTNIVLSHCPQYRDTIISLKENIKVDLVLSGHSHGGQITFFGYAPITPRGCGRYLKGWYTEADPKLYVSKGIGTSAIPIRFGARAEMVEIDL